MKQKSHPTWTCAAIVSAVAVCCCFTAKSIATTPTQVDFRYSPPEWQTAICLPDDADKSLVDRSGELLYHYGQGGREFATRVAVEVAPALVWSNQELHSPRVPIVRTRRAVDGVEIVEEAFAVTELSTAQSAPRAHNDDRGERPAQRPDPGPRE